MSEHAEPSKKGMVWLDLTVPNADEVAGFYEAVAGLERSPVSMGDYEDYTMLPAGGGEPAGGVCHARGENANLPPVWLPYFLVPDLATALDRVRERGGEVVTEARVIGEWEMAAIRDPAGANCALIAKRGT